MTPNNATVSNATTPRGLLTDTSVLLRLANPHDPQHGAAASAIAGSARNGTPLFIAPQPLYEFWVVATRPATARGGLGWTPAQADAQLASYLNLFDWLPETPAVFAEWRRLCAAYGVSGLPAHDARLVALLLVQRAAYDLAGVLTFNTRHFRRFEVGEGITVIDPQNVK